MELKHTLATGRTGRAFLFDLNGTMIDDMEFHIKAWYGILNEDLKAGLDREQVKSHMYGKNSELLDRVFGKGHFTEERMAEISMEKERWYQEAYKPHLRLIAGLPAFLERAKQQGIAMAIGSAAIPFNIDFVLDNLGIRSYFGAVVSAEDVHTSKPDPETYLKAAAALQVSPASCIVFEDAPKGVESALHAGMKCAVLTTLHKKSEFTMYPNTISFSADYTDLSILRLLD